MDEDDPRGKEYVRLICSFLVPAVLSLTIFYVNGGLDAKCDQPIPFWLHVFFVFGFCASGIAILIGPCFIDAKYVQERGVELGCPYGVVVCLVLGLMIFAIYYTIRGMILLWRTHPADELGTEQYEAFLNATNQRANLTDPLSQGNIASGLGCDGDMWRALRGWFVFQLVVFGLACFCACCASYTAMTLADMRAEGY